MARAADQFFLLGVWIQAQENGPGCTFGQGMSASHGGSSGALVTAQEWNAWVRQVGDAGIVAFAWSRVEMPLRKTGTEVTSVCWERCHPGEC